MDEFDYDVFVSYSSQDKATVHPLAERLRDDGVKVWLDDWVLEPGDPVSLKIQQGLEQSRVLLMCMSEAYFASDWATLEHHTLLFRDPTNEQRRFVPLLLEDCERPDVIAQFLHIDWREKRGQSYQALLSSCVTNRSTTFPKVAQKEREVDEKDVASNDASIATIASASRHDVYFGLAIAPDARFAISGSVDCGLKLWDLGKHEEIATLNGHTATINGLAISGDGKRLVSGSTDNTVKFWDLDERRLIATLNDHKEAVYGIAISKNGRWVVSGSHDNTLKIWDFDEQRLVATYRGHRAPVLGVAISSDGRRIVSGSEDRTLRVWDLKQKRLITSLEGHGDSVVGVAIDNGGRRAISASDDNTLKLWDLDEQRLVATLEGHGKRVLDVAISDDGQRAISASTDCTLKYWDLDEQRLLTTLEGHRDEVYGVAISSDGQKAVSASDDETLKLWELTSFETVVSGVDTTRYTNAKVVLVGESGVGKSGLALRLADNEWQETGSTHGMSVTKLDLPKGPARRAGFDEREVWLWDFAGQPDYRLIHQLYMGETALALMVIDPQKDEPFAPLSHWEQALARAVKHNPTKLLVAARCDRGGYVIGQRDIDAYLESRGYADHINTSAKLKDDPGCALLKKLIAEYIPWDRLPSTLTTALFKALKDAVIAIKETDIVLIRVVELEQRLRFGWEGEPFEERDLRTVIGLLAGQGLIQQLDFGDFVLLQPEQINNYGSAVVRAARNSKTELAELSEPDVLEAGIDFQDMERLKEDDEKILLRAMLRTFFDRSLCLRVDTIEGVKLVFPAYFKQDRPEIPKQPQIKVTYGFTGPVDEIYTTLIVRLHYSHDFESDRLWRYAADFKAFCGGRVGLLLTKERDESAKIQAYFDEEADLNTEVLFIKYIHEHLKRHADDVTRVRDYVCPECDTPLENKMAIAKRLERGLTDILCGVCERRVSLKDLIEEKFASDEFLISVLEMDRQAQFHLDNESLELILVGHAFGTVGEAGHIFRLISNSDWGIDGEIEFKNDKGEVSGRRLYVHLNSGNSCLQHKKLHGFEVFDIGDQRHSDHWRACEHPIMLVIRDSHNEIRWMNVTDYLRCQGIGSKRIVFKGEPFTAINVHKMWRRITGAGA